MTPGGFRRASAALRRLLAVSCCAASVSWPAVAATQLQAPAAVRELLSRHLPLADDAAGDATSRAVLERRLRKDAGELLATEGYFSPQLSFES